MWDANDVDDENQVSDTVISKLDLYLDEPLPESTEMY